MIGMLPPAALEGPPVIFIVAVLVNGIFVDDADDDSADDVKEVGTTEELVLLELAEDEAVLDTERAVLPAVEEMEVVGDVVDEEGALDEVVVVLVVGHVLMF